MLGHRETRRTALRSIPASGGNCRVVANAVASRYRPPTGLPRVDALAVARTADAAPHDAVRGLSLILDSRAFFGRLFHCRHNAVFFSFTPPRFHGPDISPHPQLAAGPPFGLENINRNTFIPYARVNAGRFQGAIRTACRYTRQVGKSAAASPTKPKPSSENNLKE